MREGNNLSSIYGHKKYPIIIKTVVALFDYILIAIKLMHLVKNVVAVSFFDIFLWERVHNSNSFILCVWCFPQFKQSASADTLIERFDSLIETEHLWIDTFSWK